MESRLLIFSPLLFPAFPSSRQSALAHALELQLNLPASSLQACSDWNALVLFYTPLASIIKTFLFITEAKVTAEQQFIGWLAIQSLFPLPPSRAIRLSRSRVF